jgi:hypothetical protein
MSLASNFFYYTPVNVILNYQIFKDYSDKIKNDSIEDELADLMDHVEKMIVTSESFKQQENKPIVNQTKWQSYKVKKIPLTSLFMILNKLNENNLDQMVLETLEYKVLSHEDVNQLADVFLGKCIKETKNVKLFIDYMKAIVNNNLWYVKVNDNIISFRDIMLNRLEHEYERLTKIAGHIEDVFKNRIRDENSTNDLEGGEDYLKKKNIILSLIDLIGVFFNNHLISYSLLTNIFDKLKDQYGELSSNKIYLELWLTMWNRVSGNIYSYFKDDYDIWFNWLLNQKNKLIEMVTNDQNKTKTNIADISRLINLVDNSLTNNYEIINGQSETKSFDEIIDEIKLLKTEEDYNKFKIRHNNETIRIYVIKHLVLNISANSNNSILSTSINNICRYLMSKDCMMEIIEEILDDDDMLDDYPKFRTNINNYI